MIRALPRPIFVDRRDAGRQLAIALVRGHDESALVLGLARGGVVVAAEVAKNLSLELDALVVRKLGAPQSEELAIGAVTTGSGLYLNEELIRWLEIPQSYLEAEIEKQRRLAQ